MLLLALLLVAGSRSETMRSCEMVLGLHRRVIVRAGDVSLEGPLESFDDDAIFGNSTKRLLCQVFFFEKAPTTDHALLTFATDVRFLGRGVRRKKGESLDLWSAFVAKAEYARLRALDYYLALGTGAELMTDDKCSRFQTKGGTHFLKVPAILAVLSELKNISFLKTIYIRQRLPVRDLRRRRRVAHEL